MSALPDPTYVRSEIAANPVWDLAFALSEIQNDNAPIGWSKYIWVAECLRSAFDLQRRVAPARLTRFVTEDDLRAEIARLYFWVDDLQSGMYVNCVYCGHRYGPSDTTPSSMADALKVHVAQCPAHPMAKVVKVLEATSAALWSYAFGNASPDLAKEIAAAADAVIAEVRR